MSTADDAMTMFLATVDPVKVAAERFPPVKDVIGESFGAPGHRVMLAEHAEVAARFHHWQASGRRRLAQLWLLAAINRQRTERMERADQHPAPRIPEAIPKHQQLAIAMRAAEMREGKQ